MGVSALDMTYLSEVALVDIIDRNYEEFVPLEYRFTDDLIVSDLDIISLKQKNDHVSMIAKIKFVVLKEGKVYEFTTDSFKVGLLNEPRYNHWGHVIEPKLEDIKKTLTSIPRDNKRNLLSHDVKLFALNEDSVKYPNKV